MQIHRYGPEALRSVVRERVIDCPGAHKGDAVTVSKAKLPIPASYSPYSFAELSIGYDSIALDERRAIRIPAARALERRFDG
jgi:hypothetical protein